MPTFRELLERTARDADHSPPDGDTLLDELLPRHAATARRKPGSRRRQRTAAGTRLRPASKPLDLSPLSAASAGLDGRLARSGDDRPGTSLLIPISALLPAPTTATPSELSLARFDEQPNLPSRDDGEGFSDPRRDSGAGAFPASRAYASRAELAALADRVRDLETAHVLRGRL